MADDTMSTDMVDRLKKKTAELLDADGDGKLTYDDAKKLAVALESSASSYSSSALLAMFDADGDGSISWDEAEDGARKALHRCEEGFSRLYVRLLPYERSLLCGAGFLSCFYGSNFKYTILFAQTFYATGWPTLKPALAELGASYRRGKRAYVAAAPKLAGARGALERLRADATSSDPAATKRLARDAAEAADVLRSGESVLAAVDPRKVGAVLKSAYVGLSASFSTVLSDHAAKLGVGVGLGAAVADAVNAVLAPIVSRALRALKDKALENDDVRAAIDELEDKADLDDDHVLAWVESTISLLSTAAGVYVAHRLDDALYLYSACVAGAQLCADKAVDILDAAPEAPALATLARSKRAKQALVCSLAVSGFCYQKVLGRGKLPLVVAAPLAPLKVAESILSGMAVSFRAATVAPA